MRKSGYEFYLKDCLLPVAPEKLEVKIKNANKTITLISEGEVNVLKSPGLTEVEFECVLPQVRYPFAVYKNAFLSASYFLEYFEALKAGKAPFQFKVLRSMPNGAPLFTTDMAVTLEDYTITEEAGKGFDVTVKVSLKQWREYKTRTVTLREDGGADVSQTRDTTNAPVPAADTTYTVKSGDSLYAIAKKYYGDGAKYTKIYDANESVFKGRSPNLLYAGEVLVIPAG